MTHRLAVPLVLWCAALGSAAAATQCPDSGVVVTGASDIEVREVCRGVSELGGFLASIGIALPAAVTVRVVGGEGAPALEAGAVGHYDGPRHEVLMRPCGEVAAQTVRRPPEAASEGERTVWRSYVVHELAHAAIHASCTFVRRAAHEYVAVVAQYLSLPDELRAAMLARHPDVEPFARESEISDVYYEIDPQRFAVKSWLHYRQPQGGPAFVRELLGVTGGR
jgi:hypothetical protein